MVLYAAGTFQRDWLESRDVILRDNFRQKVCVAGVMEKSITMGYCYLESPGGQQDLAAAKNRAGNLMADGVNGMRILHSPLTTSL